MTGKKYLMAAVVLAGAAGLSLSGCGMLEEKDPAMMTIDDTEYLRSETEVLVSQAVASVQQNYGEEWEKISADDTSMTEYVKGAVLDRLMNIYVFASMANAEGAVLTSEEQQAAQSEADAYLSSLGQTADEDVTLAAEAAFNDAALADSYEESVRAIAGADLTENDAAVFRGKQLIISYTDDSTRSEAKQTMTNIQSQLADGKKFNQLVSLYTDSSDINIEFSKEEATADWQKSAFDMSAGDISDLIETDGAYMLIQCITPMDEALTADHLEQMKEEAQQELIESTYEKFVSAHEVTWNYTVWDKWDITED